MYETQSNFNQFQGSGCMLRFYRMQLYHHRLKIVRSIELSVTIVPRNSSSRLPDKITAL